jgi:hypothetical protein
MAHANEGEWSPSQLVQQALESDLDPGVFSVIDETDTSKAPNFVDFCLNKKFLNVLPYPRQIEAGVSFFEEYCRDCTNPSWLFGQEKALDLFDQPIAEILDNIQLLEFGKCPKCLKTKNDFHLSGMTYFPYELAGCAGQRSGKSALVAMIAAYQLHRFLVIPDPIRFFGLLASSQLYMTMTAVSAMQAEALLWTPFKEYVDEAPWFKEYHGMLSNIGESIGVELMHRTKTLLVYKHKRIACMYEAPNKRRLRGKTRFFTAIDEIGWMEADAQKQSVTMSADEISAALDNSLRTLRAKAELKRRAGLYNCPDGIACNISSPSAKDDKIMRNVRAARDNTHIYAYHYATWEANPEITRESLEPEFQKSRMVAERDFGAVPPLADDPFIDNPNCVDMMISSSHHHNLLQVKIEYHKDDFGNLTKYAKVKVPHIDKRKPRLLLCDAGEKRNHFAVMLMTWDTKMNRARVDYVFDVSPEEGIPINFSLMWEHCFQPMCEGLLIKHMFSDTWNSTELCQKLRQHKVLSEQITLKFADFVEVAARLGAGEMILPQPELPVQDLRLTYENPVEFVEGKPVLTLILQMLTVRQVGRRITKPINGDDDMFRALALGMSQIVRPEIKRIYAVDAAGGAGANLGVMFSKSAGSAVIDKNRTCNGAVLKTKQGLRGL